LTTDRHNARFGGDTRLVIHPMQTLHVTRIDWTGAMPGPVAQYPDFDYDIAALDVPLQTWNVILKFQNGAFSSFDQKLVKG
jgi:hypothetical protein